MLYAVSYLAYNCDDGIGEKVTRTFDSFYDAFCYCEDVEETEDSVQFHPVPYGPEPDVF